MQRAKKVKRVETEKARKCRTAKLHLGRGQARKACSADDLEIKQDLKQGVCQNGRRQARRGGDGINSAKKAAPSCGGRSRWNRVVEKAGKKKRNGAR